MMYKWRGNSIYFSTDNYNNNTDLDWKFYTEVGLGIERFRRILRAYLPNDPENYNNMLFGSRSRER